MLLTIRITDIESVSGLLCAPAHARACYVLAHGAGAGMRHPFLNALSTGLANRRIATLRYQFPFMERGLRRPDSPSVAHAAVRAAIATASDRMPAVPLFAGGKSFGGRMTSQAQAATALPQLRGLIFVGFPLHPANKPSQARAEHLSSVRCPMLFLQGTRDELADVALISDLVAVLGDRATLRLFEGADHAFHVRSRSGQTDRQVLDALLEALSGWVADHAGSENVRV
ncbi:MAG: alpha/beta family hydrolase [Burkholderiaceae bacterium]